LELDPSQGGVFWFFAMIRQQLGEFTQAIEDAKKGVAWSPAPLYRSVLGHAYGMAGDRVNALKIAAELKDESKHSYVAPVEIALIYAGLGDRDAAFEWLEKAFVERNAFIREIRFQQYAKLRPDPRFEGLVKRVGLPWPITVR